MTLRSQLAACAAFALLSCGSPEPGASNQPFRLCSWNLERLGYENGKDYGAVASILEEECDASVVLEVMEVEGEAPGYDALLRELGSGWRGTRTNASRPKKASYQEHYAVLWRDTRLDLCEGWGALRLVPDGDAGASDRFDREPAFGCFRLPGGFDFLLGAYHANWDDSATVVQDEVRFIDEAVREMLEFSPEEGDLLLFGDFNLTPASLAEVTKLTIFGSGDGSSLNAAGARTDNLYDNLLVASLAETPELLDRAEVLDVREAVANPEYYVAHVSDHLPIRVTLHPSSEDDDEP